MTRPVLRDKNVLLTGATGGLGRELTYLLRDRGCRLALVARNASRLQALACQVPGSSAWSCDVASPEDVADTYGRLTREMGPPDVVFFAAGVAPLMDSRNFSVSDLEHAVRVNILGVANWLDVLLPDFIERRSGVLVGVSSLAAERGFPIGAAYCPSKAALSVLFECMRTDLTPLGIGVHLAEPGFFASRMSEGLTSTPFLIPARRAARDLIAGVEKGRFRVRYPSRARLYVALCRMLPDRWFDRVMGAGHPIRKSLALGPRDPEIGPRGDPDGER